MLKHRKLSTQQAGLILGGLSRNTVRRKIKENSLPPGWWHETEQRKQGEVHLVMVPEDDPRLALLDDPPEPAPERETPVMAPPGPQDGPDGPEGSAWQGEAPGTAVGAPGALEPLVAMLARMEQENASRWREIAELSLQLGTARAQVAARDADLLRMIDEAAERGAELGRLREERDRLLAQLFEQAEREEQPAWWRRQLARLLGEPLPLV